MDRAFTHKGKRRETQLQHQQLKLCFPFERFRGLVNSNPFSVLGYWVSKNLRSLNYRAPFCKGCCLEMFECNRMVINNSVFFSSPEFFEEEKAEMEGSIEKNEVFEEKSKVFADSEGEIGIFADSKGEFGIFADSKGEIGIFSDLFEEKDNKSNSSSDFLTSETTWHEEQSHSSSEESSPEHTLGWPVQNAEAKDCSSLDCKEAEEKTHLDNRNLEKQGSTLSEIEMMKERFAKLLLGEDMSGCGNGVSTALAISNAITNLCATLFGQLWRLEPLPSEKKLMWRREIEWLLCVSDHIVEFVPTWQTFPDGTKLEVMICRPRSDLYVNLPALRKLDNLLFELLDGFDNTEFWYIDQGILAPDTANGSSSFRKVFQRQEEKWWLPVPRVPPGGLHENTSKQLQHKRDCANQILKAAMAINSITLSDMEVPESYLEALPKNGKASLGDLIYRYISSDQFNPECLLDCLDLSSEHQAIEIANRVEASIYIWRKRVNSKSAGNTSRSSSRSSWEMVKELMVDVEKRELLADRAESLLFCLKQRFPGLPQTALDMSKIQCNKDVGKSILESYSRVLESLAFNIVARVDDLLYVDDLIKHSDQFSSISKVGVMSHKGAQTSYLVPFSSSPYKTAFSTPTFSPAQQLLSPAMVERSSFISSPKIHQLGLRSKKVLTDYVSLDSKAKDYRNHVETSGLISKTVDEALPLASQTGMESLDCTETAPSPQSRNSISEE